MEPTVVYAYHVPLDPSEPARGLAGAKVSRERLRAGDRVELSVTTVVTGENAEAEHVIDASDDEWEIVDVLPGHDDGTSAPIRGWRGPPLVWDGTLVVRRVIPGER